ISTKKSAWYKTWAAAAAVLVFVATAVTIYLMTQKPDQPIAAIMESNHDIPPGGNRATLTLADGRTITLEEARDGIVIGGDEITYNDGNPLAEVGGGGITLLELSTPKGGT